MAVTDTGFAPTFKEAVGRWRRRHRHPARGETWFAVHYRAGWLVERLTYLESVHLLRQGLDVRPLAGERPGRKGKAKGGQQQSDMAVTASEGESAPEPLSPPAAPGGG